MHAENFAVVLLPILDREVVNGAVEELDAPVAGACEDLVLVDLRPCEVI